MRRRPLAASLGIAVIAALTVPGAMAQAKSDGNPVAPIPAGTQAKAVAASDAAVASGLDRLKRGPDEQFVRTEVTKVGRPGKPLYTSVYQRTYKGVPVYGGGMTVLADGNGRIVYTDSIGAITKVATTPKVAPSKAQAAAKSRVTSVSAASKAKLTIVATRGKSTLAYETTVKGTVDGHPSVQHVYTDANTGKVLLASEDVRDGTSNGYYNGSEAITTSGSSGNFSMTDTTRSGLRCGPQSGSAYTDADDVWGNGSGTDLVTACGDAMYAGQQEAEALKNWGNYNGFNGNGGYFPARVGLADVNAYWNGSYTNFGHSQDNQRQATPIDVVAHEFGHAFFQFAGTDGSGSGNIIGGMNESTGDVMGAITEFYAANVDGNGNDDPADWLVGEEVGLITAGQPIRNMGNPSALGDPNCVPQHTSGTEVHAGAGPQNHWFALLTAGSSSSIPVCAGGAVTGIGIQKAAAIFITGMSTKNPSTWGYAAERAATVAAAKNLYGSTECEAVKAAWAAVQGPAGSEDCGSTPGNHWSMTLNPTSGSTTTTPATLTSTITTATTQGTAQQVTFSASGAPSGVTVSFSPGTVTSGANSTMSVAVAAGTANGSYPITVTGTGTSENHTATYTLTVGTVTPSCGGLPETYNGTLSGTGATAIQPNGTYWQSTAGGTFRGCLDAASTSVDFDLYLRKWNGSAWATVATSDSPGPDESITYNGTAGYYYWRIVSYSGSGAYTFSMNRP